MKPDELLAALLAYAGENPDVRAVTMEGSRADADALHDRYSDIDVCFYVTDARLFTKNRDWVLRFGDPVIMQCAEDCFKDYDPESREPFIFMMQYADESRVDLGIIDIRDIGKQADFDEPRRVLLNKDAFPQLRDIGDNSVYHVRRPTEKEYFDCCNEFRWVSVYITKGLCRRQLYYAKRHFDVVCMRQLIRMLSWHAAAGRDFRVSVGGSAKYLEKYLDPALFARFRQSFPNGEYEDIWQKLFVMYALFADAARSLADRLGYFFDEAESGRVRAFLEKRRRDHLSEE